MAHKDKNPPACGVRAAPHRREDTGSGRPGETDPILSLRGTGKAIWADEDADAYVERIREGWR